MKRVSLSVMILVVLLHSVSLAQQDSEPLYYEYLKVFEPLSTLP